MSSMGTEILASYSTTAKTKSYTIKRHKVNRNPGASAESRYVVASQWTLFCFLTTSCISIPSQPCHSKNSKIAVTILRTRTLVLNTRLVHAKKAKLDDVSNILGKRASPRTAETW